MLTNSATERILQIGIGGVGAAIAQSLNLIAENLILVDGDEYEPKNEARQAFAIGKTEANKAEVVTKALSKINENCKVFAIPEFITADNWEQMLSKVKPTLIVSCVDNQAPRDLIFAVKHKYPILWAANEVWDPQAGISTPQWAWNPSDFFSPAEGNDEGCGVQTVHANIAAAAMGTQLLHTHLAPQEFENAKKDSLPVFVARVGGNPYQLLAKEVIQTP